MTNLFVPETVKAPETLRMCSTCLMELEPVEFYKDGTDRDGNVRYRRDCKECYRDTRKKEAMAKRPKRRKKR